MVRKVFLRNAVITLASVTSVASLALAQAKPEVSVIDARLGALTMVNVLTPAPGGQEEVIRLLQVGMDEEMSHQPGFISSNIHRSLDSDHVVVYAQWQDQASVDAAVQLIQGGKAPNMLKVFSIAKPDFHPYSVVSVHPAAHSQK